MHLGDKVSGIFMLGFLLPLKLPDRITAVLVTNMRLSRSIILEVKRSKIKLLLSVYILHRQLPKKNTKFAILSSEMLDNAWVPSLVVFLWMEHDSGFNSPTSNLLSAPERSNVFFAVRIYHHFPLLFQSVELSPLLIFLQFPFSSFPSFCSSYSVFKIWWKWTAINFLNYYGFHYYIIWKLQKHAIITMMTQEAIILFSQRRMRGTEIIIIHFRCAVWDRLELTYYRS